MAHPPTRTQSRRLFSSLSIAFFLLVTILGLTALPVKAAEEPHAEYGTVIGIGTFIFSFLLLKYSNLSRIDLGTTYALFSCSQLDSSG
jgi:multidrug transporter EmrE-like cation transporter